MNVEALVLSLTTVIRPKSAAALLAMLSTRRPRRLLVAYLIGGLLFTLAIGTIFVVALGGQSAASAVPALRPAVDVALGAMSLGYAVCTGFGWWPRTHRQRPVDHESWVRRRLQDLSPSGAATAGVLTHLPGPVYLAALNAIVATASGPGVGILQVVIYNAIWFSLAIVALVLSVYRPMVPRELIDQLASWSRRHRRTLQVVFFTVLGGYLVLIGIVHLVSPPA